jgi:hypothetical protein
MNKVKSESVEAQAVEEQKKPSTGECVGKAIHGFVESLETALSGRGNVVVVRVNDEALAKMDMLVAGGICKSRSESAAFLLQRGIEGNEAMFAHIAEVTSEIATLRQELADWVQGSAG